MIVCIGDSITVGQYLPETEKPWPELILGYEIVAAGVNSDTTRLGLERFPQDVQQREPEAVVIQFGLNDCNRWPSDRNLPRVSLPAYRANLEEMVARCRAFGAEPYLCTITPTRKSEKHAADVVQYDRALRGVAYELKVPIIDVRYVFLGLRSAHVPELELLLMDDGIHLTAAGHELYASVVQEALG